MDRWWMAGIISISYKQQSGPPSAPPTHVHQLHEPAMLLQSSVLLRRHIFASGYQSILVCVKSLYKLFYYSNSDSNTAVYSGSKLLRWQARPVRDRPSSSGIRENSRIFEYLSFHSFHVFRFK
jgi:hypothetical protein